MDLTRRDLGLILPALAAATAAAQPQSKTVLPSKVFVYEDLPVKVNGENKQRAVLNGATHGGFGVEVHLTELGPGQAPHAPHHHAHEEMVMLQTGLLDVTIGGRTIHLTPGSVAYVASNEEHGWRNPGKDRAQYFVIALGREA